MTARPIVAVLLGALLGGAAITLNPLHSAPAPEPKPQRWEYKVVSLSVSRGEGEGNPAEKLTEQLNAFAKDGWEYAGPVAPNPGRGGGQYVAFRRSKP